MNQQDEHARTKSTTRYEVGTSTNEMEHIEDTRPTRTDGGRGGCETIAAKVEKQ